MSKDNQVLSKRIFITGGAGFIGSRLANQLSQQGHQVVVYDNLHPQIHLNGELKVGTLEDAVQFVCADICDAEALTQSLGDFTPSIIYHLAAETGTGQSQDEIARYTQVNVQGTAILLESVRKAGLDGLEKIILSASRAVYGECAYFDADKSHLVTGNRRDTQRMRDGDFHVYSNSGKVLEPVKTPESLPANPLSVYAATKMMQEYLMNQASMGQAFKAVNLRFQNVYGAGQSLNNPYTGVLSIFSALLLSGKTLNIFEDGQIIRDFVYVDDVVDALILAQVKQDLPNGVVINIGSGEASSILAVAKKLATYFDRTESAYQISGDFRVGDIRYSVADISLAKALLGWSAKVSLDEGLKRLSTWVKGEKA